MSETIRVKLDTISGEVILEGNKDAVRDVIENDIRGRAELMRDYYTPEDIGAEESKKALELIDKITGDHNFFRGMSIQEINRLLFEDLGWSSGPDPYPSHEIVELETA